MIHYAADAVFAVVNGVRYSKLNYFKINRMYTIPPRVDSLSLVTREINQNKLV